jgi:hypothetical protein
MRFLAMLWVVVAGLLTIPMVSPIAAQQWPSHAVRLIVPYPAGGNVDGAARIIGNKLQDVLGQAFGFSPRASSTLALSFGMSKKPPRHSPRARCRSGDPRQDQTDDRPSATPATAA